MFTPREAVRRPKLVAETKSQEWNEEQRMALSGGHFSQTKLKKECFFHALIFCTGGLFSSRSLRSHQAKGPGCSTSHHIARFAVHLEGRGEPFFSSFGIGVFCKDRHYIKHDSTITTPVVMIFFSCAGSHRNVQRIFRYGCPRNPILPYSVPTVGVSQGAWNLLFLWLPKKGWFNLKTAQDFQLSQNEIPPLAGS